VAAADRYDALDHLATMVVVLRPNGQVVFANAAFENVLSLPRRSLLKRRLLDLFAEPVLLESTLAAVVRNEYTTGRLDGLLKRPQGPQALEPMPVHVIVTQIERGERILVEIVEIEQQAKQDREARALDQSRISKELIRNLAHEIKNPLGGIRGAAQLLEMELESKTLLELLVDRLLAPHRRPHVVADVNIHEVCERVRSLMLAEYPRGLHIQRDYDVSVPEFRGDREQLIQAVLNIVRNAAQALAERRSEGQARIVLRTRAARQVTIDKQRFRLALELHVEDNGPGVPLEIRERIFYPLVSGREGGSGLGLTLAQDFIQQHHGMIECESESGRTLFRILIPLP
jgi:two-component system nitrogen regulation sensor histidine kinase GlnL